MPADPLMEVNGRLAAILQNAVNLRPLYEEIGMFLVGVVRQNFIAQGRPERWAASVRAKVTGGQTLRDTGALMNSIVSESTDKGVNVGPSGPAGKYAAVMGEGATITAKNAPYLTFRMPIGMRRTNKTGKDLKKPAASYGWFRVKSVTIPARPYLYIPPAEEDKVAQIAADFLRGEK
ncbi:MAG: phage virion morphogenesis protein [Bacteroidetes bacterium]|nr:phage virion morphogenesis protein [Bacteroidota bacterium]